MKWILVLAALAALPACQDNKEEARKKLMANAKTLNDDPIQRANLEKLKQDNADAEAEGKKVSEELWKGRPNN